MSRPGARALVLAALVATGVGATASDAQQQHGTPESWKFGLPTGDPAKGREAFAKLECYKCRGRLATNRRCEYAQPRRAGRSFPR